MNNLPRKISDRPFFSQLQKNSIYSNFQMIFFF